MLNWLFGTETEDNKEGLNFKEINSRGKAEKLLKKGVLGKLYLFPLQFGGDDAPQNIVYVPQVTIELKARYDEMVFKLLNEGRVNHYSASPTYKGKSLIPSAIKIVASGESELKEVIHIW